MTIKTPEATLPASPDDMSAAIREHAAREMVVGPDKVMVHDVVRTGLTEVFMAIAPYSVIEKLEISAVALSDKMLFGIQGVDARTLGASALWFSLPFLFSLYSNLKKEETRRQHLCEKFEDRVALGKAVGARPFNVRYEGEAKAFGTSETLSGGDFNREISKRFARKGTQRIYRLAGVALVAGSLAGVASHVMSKDNASAHAHEFQDRLDSYSPPDNRLDMFFPKGI